jgi:hypothetical protein
VQTLTAEVTKEHEVRATTETTEEHREEQKEIKFDKSARN